MLDKTLESPLNCKKIQSVSPKGNQSWIFIGRTDAEAEVPILWPPDTKNWLTGRDPDAGKDWRQEEKGMSEDEMVGWHHWLDGHEFEQALGVCDGQGSLVCCSPWGCKESDTTEQLNSYVNIFSIFVLRVIYSVVQWLRERTLWLKWIQTPVVLFTSWMIYDKLFKPCVTSLVCKIEILISLTSQSCCNIKCESTCKVLTAATAKSPQSCPTLCDPIDSSPRGSPVPGILRARILEWVAISFSNAWKWKVKVKSLSRAWLLATPWTAAYQAPPSIGFSRQEYWSGVPLPSP